MDRKLKELIEDALIKYIVDKVVEKLLQREKTALVLFTGASIGFSQSISSLNQLQNVGWKFQVVLSKAAENVMTPELIKTSLNIDKVIVEDDMVDVKTLLDNNNLVIIPSLTINSAAKIANGISDTLITNIVTKSLVSGKKIIASINACCVDNKERLSIYGDHMTTAYKNVLRGNLEKIKDFGVTLTTSENLFYKVEKKKNLSNKNIVDKDIKEKDKPQQKSNSKENMCNIKDDKKGENYKIIDKQLISRSDIYENKNCSKILINKNSLITGLAIDEAKRFNIDIIKQ